MNYSRPIEAVHNNTIWYMSGSGSGSVCENIIRFVCLLFSVLDCRVLPSYGSGDISFLTSSPMCPFQGIPHFWLLYPKLSIFYHTSFCFGGKLMRKSLIILFCCQRKGETIVYLFLAISFKNPNHFVNIIPPTIASNCCWNFSLIFFPLFCFDWNLYNFVVCEWNILWGDLF